MDNTITISGNVTRDPETKEFGDKTLVKFSVAVNKRSQVNGEWQNEAAFYDVAAWDKLGENAAASISKGDRVIVTGNIHIRYYDKKDGSRGQSVEVSARDIGVSLRWNALDSASGSASSDVLSDIDSAFAPTDPF